MDKQKLLDPDAARVLDILEQIKQLNAMIEMHTNQSKDALMVNQYEDMKNRFLEELKEILLKYEIEVKTKVA